MEKNKIIVNGEVFIDLTKDTVQPDKLAAGYTAHDKAGNEITGTNTNDVDSSGATASTAEILAGKTAAVGGQVIEGTMPNNGGKTFTISSINDVIVIPIGFHDGSGTITISAEEIAKAVPENIRDGVIIMGVQGNYTGASEVKAQAKEVTSSFTEQTVLPDEGYNYLTQVKVAPIPVTRTENAAGGITVTIGA